MRASLEPWLIAGALFLAFAALGAFLPLEDCSCCGGKERLTATFPCAGCGDRLKVSLWEEWRRPVRLEGDPDRY